MMLLTPGKKDGVHFNYSTQTVQVVKSECEIYISLKESELLDQNFQILLRITYPIPHSPVVNKQEESVECTAVFSVIL